LKVVIKVGSQTIISPDSLVLENVIIDIIRQIVTLQKQGIHVILVSSGAVALGRIIAKKITNKNYGNSIADKQLLASLGQPRLMAIYARLLEKYNIVPAQLLLTKYDFQTKRSYTNILRLLQKSVSQPNVLTIINENDSVAVEELMFTDNDELSGIIAAQIGADKLLLLTSIDGVYDKNPEEEGAKLISVINVKDKIPELSGAKTLLGRGGISSKVGTARKMALSGVMTHIANATEKDIILRLVNNDESIGSRVIPERKKAGRKKFLAFGQSTATAKIVINDCLEKILVNGQDCISILPIGIVKFDGEFAKGDLIEITNNHNKKIGIGVARYNSHKLSEYIGNKNKPAFIHYDYLHIES
jgi:glutamate 5-kinase